MSIWKPIKPPYIEYKKKVFEKAIKVGSFIHQIGELDDLRRPSKQIPINKITSKDTKAKIKYVKNCLIKYRKLTGYGRGITAVQLGIPDRFSVIYIGQTIKNVKNKKDVTFKDLMVTINPKITRRSKKLLRYPEMCMSATPIIVPTIRPAWIEFDYYNEKGNLQHWDTKDDTDVGKMMNRVFQHEFDHMEGIVNIDVIKNPREIILESDPDFYKNAKFTKV
ncbi:hypothetical protein A2715_04095 [Candidatus Woesebacteria bacterium RIFCSPHIGHO2_01_FULL_39_32]|uniref:Peptide deformylase n=2 Tax=Candidatus Woeseibacteriota TaxID=1752722 RepID=A0A0G0PPP5_9BACT|nr:MAG: hypothetical protein UT61_C0013G0028 [Candidatus Woesebacteria bacterium GW2011_GWA1_39_8]OGM03544.1 MAG: hypothetical protein A2124_02875 [Candidatus Woesebacteria bacterium GWB1_37_5]OGM25202.1 MAG: hypothetical protein A2715_04095 [Candidatus Woesebacteria bacterium RIFCSPHIGHO2_01_FULL_39_32]OGM37702.1 MAG: hypothetical protein A3F01_01300 [Candidatus Woesebacteria bacterium RIFCSPHIGHO2_12_FULL_38_11]OGM64734.1 MAG: hypothetical protein A2893_03705 [Candidatus Woesebacteria bacteri